MSRGERDGRILKEVARLIFKRSYNESNLCAMLCRKMIDEVDPEVVDENIKNTEGKFVQGGKLFKKYLLNRCREKFEKAKRRGPGLMRFIGELFKLNMITERIMHECIKGLLIFQGPPKEEEMESLCILMNTVGEQLNHVKTNK